MASDPNALPQSIVVGSFSGIKNTVSPERLQPNELEVARNVDIDDAGQLHRRRGQTKVADGDFHSAFDHLGQYYVVKDGELGTLTRTYEFTPLTEVGPRRLAHVAVGDDLYYSAETTSGKIDRDGHWSNWGALVSAGQWLSPVNDPTSTLGEISGKLLGAVPTAEHLAHYNGRIYLGLKRMLWATELYLYGLVDKTKNFIQFEYDITMLQAVDNGIYVGTDGGLFFLSGTFKDGLKRTQLTETPVIKGSDVRVPAEKVHPSGRQGPPRVGTAVVFLTTEGVFAAFDGGEAYNLTLGTVIFPKAGSAAALFRDQSGVNSYVVVADSGGTPAGNFQFGDFADAEIVRFQGS
jgi:hypothetical protein